MRYILILRIRVKSTLRSVVKRQKKNIYIYVCVSVRASLEHTSCIKPRQTCPSTHVDFKCNQMFVVLLVQNYFCFQVGRCPETNWDECHMYLVWFYLWVDPPLDPLSLTDIAPQSCYHPIKGKDHLPTIIFNHFHLNFTGVVLDSLHTWRIIPVI